MAKITNIPNHHATQVVDFPRLDGGLNLWELDYRLPNNQSPEMKNLWWQDGVLQCRDGQVYVSDAALGVGYSCFPSLFWDHAFFHIGDTIYCMNPAAESVQMTALVTGVPANRGTFFTYDKFLYYKNRGGFYKIVYNSRFTSLFQAGPVADEAYTPIIMLNTDPTTGAGDLYQPENRLSAKKTVQFTASDGIKVYKLPVGDLDAVTEVRVDGVAQASTAYTVDLAAGTVTFVTAPPVHNPVENNTVEITYEKANLTAWNSVMGCPYAAVYGTNNASVIVLGGGEAQPNAFFWNGNDSLGMHDAYWPMSSYQLAGDAEDGITGFGVQYGSLIVLKNRSVGKANYEIEAVDERNTVALTYTEINNRIGCDLPWTIALVENNVVFCNSAGGVYVVRDSSAALENNIECISKNVNGNAARPGLLHDVRTAGAIAVCGFDDDNRYWVCANGHAYLWDYVLSSWKEPSWFLLTGVPGVAYFRAVDASFHLDLRGRVTKFVRNFMDYGGAIEKVYQFPPQSFGTYDRLKDIRHCVFSVRSDTDSRVDILYQTDHEARADLTDIASLSWRLSPRNLMSRYLGGQKFAHTARRTPGCKHVRHFSMRLSNKVATQDLAIVSAQIYFRYSGRDR